jgi:hypothetical protein
MMMMVMMNRDDIAAQKSTKKLLSYTKVLK